MNCWKILKEREFMTWPEKTILKVCREEADSILGLEVSVGRESTSRIWWGDSAGDSDSVMEVDSIREDIQEDIQVVKGDKVGKEPTLSASAEEDQEEWGFSFEWMIVLNFCSWFLFCIDLIRISSNLRFKLKWALKIV